MARPPSPPAALVAVLGVLVGCAGELGQGPVEPPPPAKPVHPVGIPAGEVVRRLSALLFAAPPDAAQMAAAGRLPLADSAGVAALARSMLSDPRAARGIERFLQHWLEIDGLPTLTKDSHAYPGWSPELAQDMLAEVRRFVSYVILEGDGRLETLLTAPLAFANERLAAVYGYAGIVGPELRLLRHDTRERLGLLGLPGVIAWRSREDRTYPSHRGNLVAYRLACRPILNAEQMDPIVPDRTMRAVQDEATSYSGCQSCHHLMNPPGWAFESFDAIGARRTSDAGIPVDASGPLPPDLLDSAAPVGSSGLPDLARALAASPRAALCQAFFWLTFAVPALAPDGVFRAAESMNQQSPPPGLPDVLEAFQASGFDLRALIAAVASSPQFLAP
jgi:hypothetical protein